MYAPTTTCLSWTISQPLARRWVHEEHEAENRQQNELIDTKSDLSIQPIDPETDPGNQIVEKN